MGGHYKNPAQPLREKASVWATLTGKTRESTPIPSCRSSPRVLSKGIMGVSRHLTVEVTRRWWALEEDMGSCLTPRIRDAKDFQSGPH